MSLCMTVYCMDLCQLLFIMSIPVLKFFLLLCVISDSIQKYYTRICGGWSFISHEKEFCHLKNSNFIPNSWITGYRKVSKYLVGVAAFLNATKDRVKNFENHDCVLSYHMLLLEDSLVMHRAVSDKKLCNVRTMNP